VSTQVAGPRVIGGGAGGRGTGPPMTGLGAPCTLPLPILFSRTGAKFASSVGRPMTTRSSAIAEAPRDASCQLKSCQLPRNSAETTYMTSPDQIDGMKLEI